jgi:hypothetical protein
MIYEIAYMYVGMSIEKQQLFGEIFLSQIILFDWPFLWWYCTAVLFIPCIFISFHTLHFCICAKGLVAQDYHI